MSLGWVNAFLAYLSICHFLTIYNRIYILQWQFFCSSMGFEKNFRQRKRRKENWPFLCETHVGFVKCSGNNIYLAAALVVLLKRIFVFVTLKWDFLSLATMFMLQFVKQTTFSESTCRTFKIIKKTSILIKHIKE